MEIQMGKSPDSETERDIRKKKTILSALFTKEEPDKTLMPELRDQWAVLTGKERVKFILGGLFGLILFVGTLGLFFILLSRLFG